MRRVAITDLKNKLSQYLRLVKQGETIEILERSVPIARIQAVKDSKGSPELERLIREGVVTAPLKDSAPLREPPIGCTGDAAEAVVQERGGP